MDFPSALSFHPRTNKMKTYKEVFADLKNKKQGALVAFVVAGDPDFKTSIEIAK